MKTVLTSKEMAEADRYTIQTLGTPGIELMERAAAACVAALSAEEPAGKRIAVVTGAGNNGGDGFAIARQLLDRGHNVTVFLMFSPDRFKGDALINYERLAAMKPEIHTITGEIKIPEDVSWIVDAVFGTGLNRAAAGRFAKMIEAVNKHAARVLAVDIPSGLSGETGRLIGPAVKADLTVTFQCMKLAHAVTPACLSCGRVVVAEIGIQSPDPDKIRHFFLEAEDYARDPRPAEGHKGHFGALAVIGGFSGMEGAANLCAKAALRFGAGKVRVLTNRPESRFNGDSVMVDHIESFEGPDAYDALVIGPGLSRTESSYTHLDRFDLRAGRQVWDADGLHYLKTRGKRLEHAQWVMTPHPGEASMLLDCSAKEVQADRLTAVRELGRRYPGGWILLKGYRSLILAPCGELSICGTGNAALATAGSGDVLSGMIGALLAQKFSIEDAVHLACIRHGTAADRWTRHYRDYALIAEDIIDDLKL